MQNLKSAALAATLSTSDATIESLKFAHALGDAQTKTIDVDGRELLVSPEKLVVDDLERFQDAPNRTRRSPVFADPASFAHYVGLFAIDDTVLVGSLSKKSIVATIDYDGADAPRWGDHTATLQTIVTPEWKALRAVDGKWLSQTEVADFFETWNHIVIEPDGATIAEVAMNLQGTVNAAFEAKINRSNGSATFVCREETETNNVKVPQKVLFSVWPFEGTPLVDVLLRLRFRIESGKPRFQLVIDNPDRIESDALRATFAQVEETTERKVLVAP